MNEDEIHMIEIAQVLIAKGSRPAARSYMRQMYLNHGDVVRCASC